MHALSQPNQPRPTPPVTRTAPWQPWLRWLGWLLCWAACLSPLHSAAAAKRIALVIGNAAYQGEKPLRNPVNDARAMKEALDLELGRRFAAAVEEAPARRMKF